MSEHVRITDVAPRDGLQNEPRPIGTAEKASLVDRIARAGPDEVEITSFVSPKWIPQLGDAAELCDLVSASKPGACVYSALVPNEKGMTRALEVNQASETRVVDKVGVFTAASETFSRKNTNAGIGETIDRFRPVVGLAHAESLRVRGYISCVVGCPFEGPVKPDAVVRVCRMLAEIGVDEIDLGDTIGKATASTTSRLLQAVHAELGDDWWSAERMTLHLHDTFGAAAECVEAALALGVRSFDASAAGLGGCPYASVPGRRAPGNIATTTLLRTIERAGFSHGVDHDRLADAERFAQSLVAENAS